jgi:hypothetical protein
MSRTRNRNRGCINRRPNSIQMSISVRRSVRTRFPFDTASVTQLTNNDRYEFQIQDHHLIGLDVPSIRSLKGLLI